MLSNLFNTIRLSNTAKWTSMSGEKVHELGRYGGRILGVSRDNTGFKVGVYPAESFAKHELGAAWGTVSIQNLGAARKIAGEWHKRGKPKNIFSLKR